jgi:hypothetical protein
MCTLRTFLVYLIKWNIVSICHHVISLLPFHRQGHTAIVALADSP